MKNIKDLKDKATTIAGILMLVSGLILGLPGQGVEVIGIVHDIAVVAGSLGAAVIAYLTGKNADGTKKRSDQIDSQK